MYKHNIVLTICDRHVQDREEDSSELMTTGVFEGTDDDYTIEYDEQDEALRCCRTSLHVENDGRVTMVRTGESATELIFEAHGRHICQYETPYGSFMLGVYTKQIASKVDASQGFGVLALRYTLDFNGLNSTENELQILFKEVSVCP